MTFPEAYLDGAVSGHKFNAGVKKEVEELAGIVEKTNHRLAGAVAFGVAAAVAIGTIAGLHGQYKGWQKAKEGKEQYDALKVNASALKGRAEIAEAAAAGKGAGPSIG